MPLDRNDLEYFADQINANINRVESSLSKRLDDLSHQTTKNVVDIAVLKDRQAQSVQNAKKVGGAWGAGLGTAFGTAAMMIYTFFFGSPSK